MATTPHHPITRRSFIARTGTALAMPLVLPATRLFGQAAPSKLVNVALIGCGSRAETVLLKNEAVPGVRFVAAVDPFADRRESFATRLNEKYGTDACVPVRDFREIIGRSDIDAVGVFTPDHWHVAVALAAARHGKHMYVEKPLGIALAWAWRLREEILRSGVVFQYGTQQRSGAHFRQACELVRNGYIGQVRRVDVWCPALPMDQQVRRREEPVPAGFDYDLWTGPAPLRPYQPERVSHEGAWHCPEVTLGFIANWGAHPVDICQWGLDMDAGGPVRYEGAGLVPAAENELYATTRRWEVRCDYANGIKMRFMDQFTAEPVVKAYHYVVRPHGTVFHGDEGWIGVDRSAMYSHDANRLRKVALKPTDARLPGSEGHFLNFVQAVKTRGNPVSPFEAAIRSDTICHLAEIAVRTGSALEWDPAAEKIVGGTPAQVAMLDRPVREAFRF